MQFPEKVHNALQQHRRIQDPPREDWPVFPTRHRPTLYGLADDVDADRDEEDIMTFLTEHDQRPPSITTQSVRNLLQRLCDDGEIDVEGDHDYLKPHGARRGVGKKLYKNHSAEAAQKALRHQDPQTTSEMYADIGAGEVADIVEDQWILEQAKTEAWKIIDKDLNLEKPEHQELKKVFIPYYKERSKLYGVG
jgi:integrase